MYTHWNYQILPFSRALGIGKILIAKFKNIKDRRYFKKLIKYTKKRKNYVIISVVIPSSLC